MKNFTKQDLETVKWIVFYDGLWEQRFAYERIENEDDWKYYLEDEEDVFITDNKAKENTDFLLDMLNTNDYDYDCRDSKPEGATLRIKEDYFEENND